MNQKQISKFLSLILRHQPEVINLQLDTAGWAKVDELLAKLAQKGMHLDLIELQEMVATNPKQRFRFNEDQTLIRANQGHSIPVDLGFSPTQPPTILYHGTAERNVPSIQASGLLKGNRQHVHLSADRETAIMVGQRHGKPVDLTVLAEQMHQQGIPFFLSDNKVWLTDYVDPKFIQG